MEVHFYRGEPLLREAHHLPGDVYNLARTLMISETERVLFLPLRSMQVMAAVDEQEIVFVNRLHQQEIEVAWQHFQPQVRTGLTDRVPYEAIFYTHDAHHQMARLQSEFARALKERAARRPAPATSRVLPFAPRG